MRNASIDSFEVLIVIAVGLIILAVVGYAMCKVLGLEIKVISNFAGMLLTIIIGFLIVAQIIIFFFGL